MEQLQREGHFSPPSLSSLEMALEQCLALPAVASGRVRTFADLWDIERLATCPRCVQQRIERLKQMNDTQAPVPAIECGCGVTA